MLAMMRGSLLKNKQKQLFIIVDSASRWHGVPPHKKIAQRYLTKVALRRVTETEEITWQAFMESDFSSEPKL